MNPEQPATGHAVAGAGTRTFGPGETAKVANTEAKGNRKTDAGGAFDLDLFVSNSKSRFGKDRGTV